MNRRSWLILLAFLVVAGWVGVRFFRPQVVVNTPPKEGVTIAFGDSLTEGVGASPETSYPAHLARLLNRPILNRGIRGETAGDALRRFEAQVLGVDPGLVLVCLGGNDILRRKDPEDTFAALEEIVSRLIDQGAMVVVLGVEGPPILTDDFNSRYEKLSRQYGCLYIPDILDGLMGKDQYMSDPIHPNAEGYRKIAERVARKLEPYL